MYTMRDFIGFLVGAAIAVACILLLLPPSPCPCGGDGVAAATVSMPIFFNGNPTHAGPSMKKIGMPDVPSGGEDKLLELLGTAAMEDNKTIIMTFTNEAFAAPGSLMDLFLESFRRGMKTEALLKHLVIVAVDAKAFERCQHRHRALAATNNGTDFSSEQPYMARDYVDMMWFWNRFQARVLELGFNFVFTDVDTVWFQNPLLRIPVGADIAMSSDVFYGDSPYDLHKNANGGFLYVKSRARTVAFYGDWYAARAAYPGKHEQFVFVQVKHELAARHAVAVQFVDTIYLGGFCQPTDDFYKVCTFHANCVAGLQPKLDNLRRVFNDWKQFRANNSALMDRTCTSCLQCQCGHACSST